jgi:chemotaxis family two-component system response regulator Rcp1
MTLQSHRKPIEILLVEDNRSDAILVQEALKEMQTPYRLTILEDGEQALAYLRRQDPYADAPHPDLILLDLDLPRKSGRDTLAEIKEDPALQHIPVLILTCSHDTRDIEDSYRLHANSYIVKPPDFNRLLETIKAIEQFWFSVVTLFEEDVALAPLPPNGHDKNGHPPPTSSETK